MTRTTCPYCGVGCGVIVESDGTQITAVRGDPDHPANFGRLCSKGSTLHLTTVPHLVRQARLLAPMRRAVRGGEALPLVWDAALAELTDRLASTIETHGPDAVGLYLSGQLLTEDYYAFNKLARALIGTHNVDSNSRLCMSSAVAGYKQSLGADAPPACYEDLALAQTVFIAGSNLAWAHPVLMRRLEDAKRAHPGQRWIVVDPRRTETAAQADLHLALRPGTDVMLFHALLHVMLWEGLVDHGFIAAHTSGFDALRERVREATPAQAARVCGVAAEDIVQAARWFGGATPTLSLYCQGLNQSTSGTDKNSALINLHLATGQIGKPGAGPLSLTGQPNAMGGREVGAMATLLPGHRDPSDPGHRAELAALWGVPKVPSTPGRTALEMFEAAADGQIRLLWIVCTNPAQSLPDQALVRRALERAEFVVLQEAYSGTATAAFADLLLPATSWGEKDGTVTNSERRISRMRAALPPPGEARHDWAIAVEVGRRLQPRLPGRAALPALFDFADAGAIWREHRETTRGRDLDITGLDWSRLETPAQWPCPEGASTGATRLYTDGRFPTPDGRARFVAPAWRQPAERRDARHPFALNTGRLRDQWHGMSRTGTLARLFEHAPEPAVHLNPQDLARRGWKAGEFLSVSTRRGALVLPARPDDAVAPAQAFIAMHWGGEYIAGAGINQLTSAARCPQSKQPELKHAAARIERADVGWSLCAAAWIDAQHWVETQRDLRSLLDHTEYLSVTPFGREPEVGLLVRAAAKTAPSHDLLVQLERLLAPGDAPAMRYADPQRGQWRMLRMAQDGTLQSMAIAGDTRAAAWLLPLLQRRGAASGLGAALLSGAAHAPQPVPAASAQVCSCHDVREDRIVATLAELGGDDGARLAALQGRLRCGTECGSCLPALREWVRRVNPVAA